MKQSNRLTWPQKIFIFLFGGWRAVEDNNHYTKLQALERDDPGSVEFSFITNKKTNEFITVYRMTDYAVKKVLKK